MSENLEELGDSPVARHTLNSLLFGSIQRSVEQLLIEPVEGKITAFINAIPHPMAQLSQDIFWGMVVRLRVMAGLGLDVGGEAKTGEFELQIPEQLYTVRVTTQPVLGGEDLIVTIRLKN